jgi:hypothetical protein
MVDPMMESILKIKNMVLEFSSGMTVENILVIGKMENYMVII